MSGRDSAREILVSVSKMEEFRVRTARTEQVLKNIEALLRAVDAAATHLHRLFALLETQASLLEAQIARFRHYYHSLDSLHHR